MQKNLILFLVIILSPGISGQNRDLQDKLNRKQFREIIEAAEKFSAADSADFSTMYTTAQAYDGLLKYRQALQLYRHCLQMDSTNIDLLNTLGRTAVNLGRATEAKNYFFRVLENDSSNFYATHQLARLYFQIGEYENALTQYSFLAEEDPENTSILKSIGDCFIRLKEINMGINYYEMAYEHNKENASLANLLVNNYYQVGGELIQDGLVVCDTALSYNPENLALLRNKALGLYLSKKYNEADSLYTYLLEERKDSTYATLAYTGATRFHGGFPLNAVEPLRIAYSMDTTSVNVPMLLGGALGKTYDRNRAHELFNIAEKNMQPEKSLVEQLNTHRAETYARDGNYAEASRIFYEIWKKKIAQIELLGRISSYYYHTDPDKTTDENRQRTLFIHTLYVREALKANTKPEHLIYQRSIFKKFYEEMFFRGIKDLPTLAPDGKKSKISMDELKELMDIIPERKK